MSRIRDRICDRTGAVWTPSDFIDLAERAAIDKALQRLEQSAQLRRITRGIYDIPKMDAELGVPAPPDPAAVIDAIARRDGVRILIDGLAAAKDLGLTSTSPSSIIVRSEARSKTIEFSGVTITFKQTAARKLHWAGRPAMRIVQALHWLRTQSSKDGLDVNDAIDIAQLKRLLCSGECAPAIRADLADGLPSLPAWMQSMIRSALKEMPEVEERAGLPPGTRLDRAVKDSQGSGPKTGAN